MTNEEIRIKLEGLAEKEYLEFSKALTPGAQPMLGVRVPKVKEIAKEIAAGDYSTYLKAPFIEYHEECLLYGLVIGYIKADIAEILHYVDNWLPCVQNWAVCDSSIMNMKAFGNPKNKAEVWRFLTKKLAAENAPYIKRAVIVAMFAYYNTAEYVRKVSDIYLCVIDDHYYVKMALAWGIAEIAIKNYDIAIEMLQSLTLDKWVQNKAIQKSCESFRLTPAQKNELRLLKMQKKLS